MALVHKKPVNAKLLERHHVVLAFGIVQLVKPCREGFPALFHLLYRVPFPPLCFCKCDGCLNVVYLLLDGRDLPLRGQRDLLKLRMSDDDRVVIAGGDA